MKTCIRLSRNDTPVLHSQCKSWSLSDVHQRPPTSDRANANRRPDGVEIINTARAGAQHTTFRVIFTLGHRGFQSSARLGSVASVGNQEKDVYYRNDSLE